MTDGQWNAFCEYRDSFKTLCAGWKKYWPELFPLVEEARKSDTPDYPLENAIVYNVDYDAITKNDEIKLIVIGDNPGKDEQLNKNRRYLVGQSGKLADHFFRDHPELGVDFRKNVIIMNKTPVHTAKTLHLKKIAKAGGAEINSLIKESQVEMARLAAELHTKLVANASEDYVPELWLVGFSELKEKGIFGLYRETLKETYAASSEGQQAWNYVRVYKHFSMNCFNTDFKKRCAANENSNSKTTAQILKELGLEHRENMLGGLEN